MNHGELLQLKRQIAETREQSFAMFAADGFRAWGVGTQLAAAMQPINEGSPKRVAQWMRGLHDHDLSRLGAFALQKINEHMQAIILEDVELEN